VKAQLMRPARVAITRCAAVTSQRSSGVWKVRGRARGADQLQKSTGGTWPARPGEQPVGVADLAHKGCARKRVGSWTEVAKPRYQWRLRRFTLSASDRVGRTRTRRWKALRAWETAAWVCRHVERVLGSGGARRPKGRWVDVGATGSVSDHGLRLAHGKTTPNAGHAQP
jgi:hypothetical protein